MNKQQEKRRSAYYENELILPPECDVLCPFRTCYQKGENKGSYTPGRGYTSYYDDFRPVCGSRMRNGCDERDSFDTKKAIEWCIKALKKEGKPREKKIYYNRALDVLAAIADRA